MQYIKVTLKGGAEVTFDLDRKSICKRCKKDIWWACTKNAKQMPVRRDTDGGWISHMVDCSTKRPEDLLSNTQRQEERDRWL